MYKLTAYGKKFFIISWSVFAIIGILWTYYNWQELLVKPFKNEVQVLKIEAGAQEYIPKQ